MLFSAGWWRSFTRSREEERSHHSACFILVSSLQRNIEKLMPEAKIQQKYNAPGDQHFFPEEIIGDIKGCFRLFQTVSNCFKLFPQDASWVRVKAPKWQSLHGSSWKRWWKHDEKWREKSQGVSVIRSFTCSPSVWRRFRRWNLNLNSWDFIGFPLLWVLCTNFSQPRFSLRKAAPQFDGKDPAHRAAYWTPKRQYHFPPQYLKIARSLIQSSYSPEISRHLEALKVSFQSAGCLLVPSSSSNMLSLAAGSAKETRSRRAISCRCFCGPFRWFCSLLVLYRYRSSPMEYPL